MSRFLSSKTSSNCMSAGRSNNCVASMGFVFKGGSPGEVGSFSFMLSLLTPSRKVQQSPVRHQHCQAKSTLYKPCLRKQEAGRSVGASTRILVTLDRCYCMKAVAKK